MRERVVPQAVEAAMRADPAPTRPAARATGEAAARPRPRQPVPKPRLDPRFG